MSRPDPERERSGASSLSAFPARALHKTCGIAFSFARGWVFPESPVTALSTLAGIVDVLGIETVPNYCASRGEDARADRRPLRQPRAPMRQNPSPEAKAASTAAAGCETPKRKVFRSHMHTIVTRKTLDTRNGGAARAKPLLRTHFACQSNRWRIEMAFEKSRRTVLVFTMVALGAIALDAPAALAASPIHGPTKALGRSHAHVYGMNGMSVSHAFRPQHLNHVDDPFSSLLLG